MKNFRFKTKLGNVYAKVWLLCLLCYPSSYHLMKFVELNALCMKSFSPVLIWHDLLNCWQNLIKLFKVVSVTYANLK